jgi:hypothetical protein
LNNDKNYIEQSQPIQEINLKINLSKTEPKKMSHIRKSLQKNPHIKFLNKLPSVRNEMLKPGKFCLKY